jgi:hypothetical protein
MRRVEKVMGGVFFTAYQGSLLAKRELAKEYKALQEYEAEEKAIVGRGCGNLHSVAGVHRSVPENASCVSVKLG